PRSRNSFAHFRKADRCNRRAGSKGIPRRENSGHRFAQASFDPGFSVCGQFCWGLEPVPKNLSIFSAASRSRDGWFHLNRADSGWADVWSSRFYSRIECNPRQSESFKREAFKQSSDRIRGVWQVFPEFGFGGDWDPDSQQSASACGSEECATKPEPRCAFENRNGNGWESGSTWNQSSSRNLASPIRWKADSIYPSDG